MCVELKNGDSLVKKLHLFYQFLNEIIFSSSFDWNDAPYDVPDMFSKPGTPCNDYNGYCDVFQKCREVDPSGPLATLRKLLLSEESLAIFKRWVTEHWYTVLAIVVSIPFLLVS